MMRYIILDLLLLIPKYELFNVLIFVVIHKHCDYSGFNFQTTKKSLKKIGGYFCCFKFESTKDDRKSRCHVCSRTCLAFDLTLCLCDVPNI